MCFVSDGLDLTVCNMNDNKTSSKIVWILFEMM